MKFFESTNAKVFGGETYVTGQKEKLTVTAVDSDGRVATVQESLTEDEARAPSGKL